VILLVASGHINYHTSHTRVESNISERRKIEERLRKKEQEIAELEEQIKAARIYLQALQDVLKILPKAPDPTVTAEAVLRPGSAVAQAREVILERGEPVQILELLQALNKEPTRENRASLTSSLAAYVRRGEIFTRPAPNTFGLIELGHHTSEVDLEDHPPTGFGGAKPSPPPPARPAPTSPKVPSPPTVRNAPDDDDDEIPF
jgi:hypothetical protein